jgi:ribosome-associated translation inhibitor RaiA
MDVVIRSRGDHLLEQLRTYVDKKVRGLGDHFDLARSVDVEFDRDVKKRPEPLHIVKITLHLLAHRTSDLRVKETGRDQRATFDVAIARIEAEALQLKERIKARP